MCKNALVIVSKTLPHSVFINRHDYDIFNQQINIYHLDIVIGIK